jgi:uncharacterized protein (TIGR02996 family)
MSKRDELLAAIIAEPGNRTARQVYADLLQQEGDARGEFIATQLARSALKTRAGAKALITREDEILKKHKKKWIAFAAAKGARWEFRDGFAEKLSLDAVDLVRAGAAIFATEPVVELSVWKIDSLAPVLALPGLARIRHLTLARSHLSEHDIAALAAASTLGAVEVLDVSESQLGDRGIGVLARSHALPKLRELRVRSDELGPAAMTAIDSAEWAGSLVALDLFINQIGDAGARTLAKSERLAKLTSLVLTHNGITDNVLDDLLASPLFARLEHLDLAGNLTESGIMRMRDRFGRAVRWDGRG